MVIIGINWHCFKSCQHDLDQDDCGKVEDGDVDGGQVDAYRDSGKEEAAIRLEEQLSLIHTRFQVALDILFVIFLPTLINVDYFRSCPASLSFSSNQLTMMAD